MSVESRIFFFSTKERKEKRKANQIKSKLTLNICLPWCQVPSTATRMYSPPLTGPKAKGRVCCCSSASAAVAVVVSFLPPPPPSSSSPSPSSPSPSTTDRGIPLSATSFTSNAPGPGNISSTGIFFSAASSIASSRAAGHRSPSNRRPRGTSTLSSAADSRGTVASLLFTSCGCCSTINLALESRRLSGRA